MTPWWGNSPRDSDQRRAIDANNSPRWYSARRPASRLNALVHPGVVRREGELIAEFAARERGHRGGGGGHPHRAAVANVSTASSWCGAVKKRQVERLLRRGRGGGRRGARASAGRCRSKRTEVCDFS